MHCKLWQIRINTSLIIDNYWLQSKMFNCEIENYVVVNAGLYEPNLKTIVIIKE